MLSEGERTLENPSESTFYEVRCHACQCSFAPGTRRCLHCGGPLGAPREAGSFGQALLDESADPEVQVPSLARIALWVLSAGLAIALSALQTCGR